MTAIYDYYPSVMYALEKISQGMTETRACDEARITIHIFRSYIKNDPQLQAQHDECVQRGIDAMAEALLDPQGHVIYGHSNPAMAKIQSDNIRWFLSKKAPKQFGDKVEITHHVTADAAIVAALTAGKHRAALSYEEAEVIDVEPIYKTEEEQLAELL